MELKQLEYFVAVVETGTISSAAKQLNMTQPPLSLSMKQLESELQTQLFERGSRRITLTQNGKVFYHYALQMIELQKLTVEAIHENKNTVQPPIHIGLISSFESEVFYDHVTKFIAKYPATRFDVVENNTYELIDLLDRGQIDLAIIRTPYQSSHIEGIDLSQDHLVAIGSKRYQKELTGSTTLKQLQDIPLIIYRRWETILKEEYSRLNIDPHFLCINDDARTSMQWAMRGLGIALVPSSVVGLAQDVYVSEVTDLKTESHLRLVKRKGSFTNEITEAFYSTFK